MNQNSRKSLAMVLIMITLGLTFSLCIGVTGASTNDWAMFHNDLSRTGYSTSSGPNTNQTGWIYATASAVRCSPAVANGIVYVGSFGGDFYAINASTGGELWSCTTGGDVWSSPAVANGIVYVGTNGHYLYAFDANTGAKLWSFLTGGGVFSSPAVSGNVVYIGATDDNVYALDATTGTPIWTYTTGNQVRASPVIADGVLYIASEDGFVYALNASTGAELWNSPTSPGDSFICSSPALANNVIYVGAHDGKVYAFNAATGTEIWNYTTGNVVESSPAVANGIVYVGSDDGNVYALDAATGTLRWSFTTSAPVYSSPAVASGLVYIGGWNGYVYALDTATGAEAWSYKTGSSIFSSPAIADGVLYIGSYDSNVCTFGTYVAPSPPLSNQSIWVPAPANAVTAAVVAGVATGLVSLVFAAFTNPLGGLGGEIGDKIKAILPDNLKKWLEDYVASRQKLQVEEKSGSPLVPTSTEILAYVVLIILLTISFSYVKASSLVELATILPVYFATSVLVGLVKKFFSVAFLRSRGVWTEHKVWPFGLGLFLFSTFVFKVPFSSPTRNVHFSAKLTKRLGAMASASEIFIGLAFAGFFALLMYSGFVLVGSAGLAMCLMGAFFDTFPIPPMSGKDIYDHSKALWVILFALTLILYASWLILL